MKRVVYSFRHGNLLTVVVTYQYMVLQYPGAHRHLFQLPDLMHRRAVGIEHLTDGRRNLQLRIEIAEHRRN